MTVDLLAVVKAEAQADALIREAHERQEEALRTAAKEREQKLAELQSPSVQVAPLPALHSDATKLKETARRNTDAAVKLILEELYAS